MADESIDSAIYGNLEATKKVFNRKKNIASVAIAGGYKIIYKLRELGDAKYQDPMRTPKRLGYDDDEIAAGFYNAMGEERRNEILSMEEPKVRGEGLEGEVTKENDINEDDFEQPDFERL